MKKVSYIGNGSTTEFYFTFQYFENSNIVVTKNDAPATGYNIIGTAGGADANIPFFGGKVVFETAPAITDRISIARALPLTRIADYQPTARIEPTTLNQDLNYLLELIKDRQSELELLKTQCAEIADKESTAILLAQIDAIHNEIVALGDIASIHNSIATLNSRTDKMTDYVVASQVPSPDNNYTWYRKYKSGWVEQGGRNAALSSITQNTLSIAMANKSYAVQLTRQVENEANDPAAISLQVRNLSTTGFQVYQTYSKGSDGVNGLGSGSSYAYNWVVFGHAA